ncbi:MAG TPA: nuclear transport factor 2 family protein [Polyangiaceae bacterium]|nr:nuclear transport factor 2 family protein [Polyangiaceae bacterium]
MESSLPYRLWKAFAAGRVDDWDPLLDERVVTQSPIGRDIRGPQALKDWGRAFHGAFIAASAPETRIELVDLSDAGDRPFLTVNLIWKHDRDFFGLAPTGRSGTSIETFLLRTEGGKVVEWLVADQTLDLVSYLTGERGLTFPRGVRPQALARPGL